MKYIAYCRTLKGKDEAWLEDQRFKHLLVTAYQRSYYARVMLSEMPYFDELFDRKPK